MTIALLVAVLAQAAPAPLTIQQAVERALKNYAAIDVSREKISAATAGVQLARTAFLPRADLLAQANRASRNNIFGLLLPQSTLPAISGPPRPENDLTSVWGSAAGLLVSWDFFDFGLRRAGVEAAAAGERRAAAALKRTEFEIATLTADAFLTALAAEASIEIAKAGITRARSVEEATAALVKAELRAGADSVKAQLETARAEMQLAQAEQAAGLARTSLKQFCGEFSQLAPVTADPAVGASANVTSHPALAEQTAAIVESKSREQVLDKSYRPKLALQGSTYARGTGANADGSTLGGVNGLGPNIVNYGVGVTVTFPVLSLSGIRAQRAAEAAKGRAEAARYKQILQDLNAQLDRAQVELASARRISGIAPRQRDDARTLLKQTMARYQAGLGIITEVADAQREVTAAESEAAIANLAVWRAWLHVVTAQGDLTPFLAAAR